jgi:hypothetical protein
MSAQRGLEDPWEPVNFRAPKSLRGLIDDAVSVSGMGRSDWLREAIEAGALREITEASRQEQEMVTLGRVDEVTFGKQVPRECEHPRKQRWIGVRTTTCLQCGTSFMRRVG